MIGGHRRCLRLIERAFVHGLSARQRSVVREHLSTCDRCQDHWDRLAIVDRRLGGLALSATTLDDIRDRIIGDRVIAARVGRRHLVWVAAGSLAAVASVLLLLRGRAADTTLQPRGDGEHIGRTAGVRMFCVSTAGDRVVAEARLVSTPEVPSLRCTLDHVLQIAYTTPSFEGLTMIAFSRNDDSMHLYVPSGDGLTVPVAADRIDELIEWSTRLEVNHRPGSYEVVVRFFDRLVSTREAIDSSIVPVVELRGRLEVLTKGAQVDEP